IGSTVLGVAVAVAGSAILLIAFGGGGRAPGHSPTPSSGHTQVEGSSPTPGTEVIDPAGPEVFAPAPATARPRLSAEEAWALFARRIHAPTTIPANVTAHLGLLTFPIGPIGPGGAVEYHAKNLLVYGFSSPSCGPRTNPLPPPNSTVSPQPESLGTCTFWTFLDADTAREIDETTQYRHSMHGNLPSTIIIDAVQGIRFDPPGPEDVPSLTEEQALARYESANTKFTLPADATSYLGLYTAPVGDGTFRFHERLAWGIRWPGCPVDSGNPGFLPGSQPSATSAPSPRPESCAEWLFLDANTGQMLEAVWQH
ncbi:MAG TPA: hypothetical protein VID47_07555, partial [Actinomycetota bacterium]